MVFCLYNRYFFYKYLLYFTPFRIENAQSASPSSFISARKAGDLNEKRCNNYKNMVLFYKLNMENRVFFLESSFVIEMVGVDSTPFIV